MAPTIKLPRVSRSRRKRYRRTTTAALTIPVGEYTGNVTDDDDEKFVTHTDIDLFTTATYYTHPKPTDTGITMTTLSTSKKPIIINDTYEDISGESPKRNTTGHKKSSTSADKSASQNSTSPQNKTGSQDTPGQDKQSGPQEKTNSTGNTPEATPGSPVATGDAKPPDPAHANKIRRSYVNNEYIMEPDDYEDY